MSETISSSDMEGLRALFIARPVRRDACSTIKSIYLGVTNIDRGLDSDVLDSFDQREERVRRLGELARILTDSGQIFITTITDVDVHDVKQLIALNAPSEILVVVAGATEYQDVHADVQISDGQDLHSAVEQVYKYLQEQEVIPDYCI